MNRLGQEYGMKWYKFLLVITPFGIISDAVRPLMDVSNVASNNGVQFGDIVSALPGYVIPHILSGFIIALTLAVLEYHLYKRSSLCAPLVRLYLAVCTFLFIVLAILEYHYAGYVDAAFFSNLFSTYVIWVPTYFYLKKRFSESEYHAAPAESITHTETRSVAHHDESVHKAETTQQTAPQTSVPQVMTNLIDMVASQLEGITDQEERDRRIAAIFRNRFNPYTDRAVDNEAEWNAYVEAYYQDLSMPKREPVETECASKPASAPEPESAVQTNEHCSENLAVEPETPSKPEAQRPKFCRKCGKPLRADSYFCEWCGESVK